MEQKNFDAVESDLRKMEQGIGLIRAFVQKHRDALAVVKSWTAGVGCFGTPTVVLRAREYTGSETEIQPAREIAPLFGRDGWTREPDRYACGKIDWHKEIDGIKVSIDCAEQIKPLIKDVKLPAEAFDQPPVTSN